MRRNTARRDKHRAIIARSKPPCAICGQPIDYELRWLDEAKRIPHPKSYVVDHKQPLSRGGRDTIDNKQATHRQCNREKSNNDNAMRIIKRSNSLIRPK